MKRLRALGGRRDLIDGGLVAAIVALGVAEIWLVDLTDAERLRLTVGLLISTLPLLVRRRQPLVSIAAIVVALPLAFDIYDKTNAIFGAALVAIYSVAAYASARRAFAGLAIVVGAFMIGMATDDALADILFVAVIIGPVFAGGRLVRANRATAAAMADRADLAEREREERARAAVAEERSRIARELHDVVAHSISVMVVQAGAERRALESGPSGETRDVLRTIEDTGRETLAEMRRLLGMLRRSDDEIELAPQPSMTQLDRLVEQVREAGLPVTLSVEGEQCPLPAAVDLSAYRIVQEALTNALKHAGPAARARVTVSYGDDQVLLDIVDDGAGAPATNGGGHGLIGMRERVTMFGGEIATGTRTEGGYAVRARLPLE